MKLKFFELCKKLRLHSDHDQHKMACVIARGNKLISTGFNLNKTHPVSKTHWNTLHAEISALIKADPEACYGAQAYVYRERKDKKMGNARPCQACYAALKEAGIKTVYFSTEEGYTVESL